MPKNIVLLSDGTGNAAAKVWRTNVWRTYQALDLSDGNVQIASYEDGVGTSSFKPLALLGGAFGFGLKRNVLQLYKFLCLNYEPGDRIYCFGFSRGAYTIRLLAGMIAYEGVFDRKLPAAQAHRRALDRYRAYRAKRFVYPNGLNFITQVRALRDFVVRAKRLLLRQPDPEEQALHKPNVAFVGVWDTVAAYGLPTDEMTRGIDLWFWPISPTDRVLSDRIEKACHAVALDDERTTFHPLLFTEVKGKKHDDRNLKTSTTQSERVSQVWFSGMHANVGGGYPDDSLSYVPLDWILTEAVHAKLHLKASERAFIRGMVKKEQVELKISQAADQTYNGKIYDSRSGLSGFYRYGPRSVAKLSKSSDPCDGRDDVTIERPKIHKSVFERIRHHGARYAPIGLPEEYAVVDSAGKISPGVYETKAEARTRFSSQEKIWDYVWCRRVIFFLTLFWAAYLLVLRSPGDSIYRLLRFVADCLGPILKVFEPAVAAAVSAVTFILPSFVGKWLHEWSSDTGVFILQLLTLALGLLLGKYYEDKIRRRMWDIWKHVRKPGGTPPIFRNGFFYRLIHWIRTKTAYTTAHRLSKRQLLPTLFAAAVVIFGASLVFVGVSRISFAKAEYGGRVCAATHESMLKPVNSAHIHSDVIDTRLICKATGVRLVKGERYCLRIARKSQWYDATTPAGLEGVAFAEASTGMKFGLPLRRIVLEPYLRPIAQIGHASSDVYPLSPQPYQDRQNNLDRLDVEMTARRDGELFFYVNDAIGTRSFEGWPHRIPVWFGLSPLRIIWWDFFPYDGKQFGERPMRRSYFYENNLGTADVRIERLLPGQQCTLSTRPDL